MLAAVHQGAGCRAGAWVLILGILASACTGSTSPPADRAGRSTLQLRVVRDIIPRTSPKWDGTQLTCPAEDAAACLAAVPAGPVIVSGADMEKYVLGPVISDEGDVEEATAHEGQPASMGWSVDMQLSPGGSDALAAATTTAVGSRIAIVVDGVVVSAPTVAAPITSGAVVVDGGLSKAEAERLASGLGARG